MTEPCLLIADIGGTSARFALAEADIGDFRNRIEFPCADHGSVTEAIRHYLAETQSASPDRICLAVAGPVVDDTVCFTNNDWSISSKDLEQTFGATQVRLINDFEAKALAIGTLGDEERLPIGNPNRANLRSDNFTVGIVGPGTGLGAAGLIRHEGDDIALVTEAGHVSFAPQNAIQQEICSLLGKEFGRVSSERLLSGPGIENVYHGLRQIHGMDVIDASAAQIGDRALSGTDDIAIKSFGLFFEVLGQVAGDFALAIGAFDGIFLSGGIARRYEHLLQQSQFRSGFENKGRYRSLMEKIPTELITHSHAGLRGASVCAVRMFQA